MKLIVTLQTYKTVKNNKKWYRGYFNLTKKVAQRIGKEDKNMILFILEEGEVPSMRELQDAIEEAKLYATIRDEVEEMKKEDEKNYGEGE